MALSVVATAFGGPDVLELRDLPVPDPGPGEVVVDVRAAGANPADWKRYSGQRGFDPSTLPLRIGFEIAGVVSEAGPDAKGPTGTLRPGDEVVAFRVFGGYAEQLLVPAKDVLHKPASLSFEQASGLLLAGSTALHAFDVIGLHGAGEGHSADTLLVHGGAGAVGLLAAQLARQRGVRVIATASPARHDQLRAYGAVPVEYGPGLHERVEALGPITAAFDCVGTDEAVDVSLALLAANGVDKNRFVTIAAFARAAAEGLGAIGGHGPGSGGHGMSPHVRPGQEFRDNARAELLRLAGQGDLEVVVDRTFPLREAAAAHRYLQTGHARGKVVLIP
ncbi:MAG: NADP-dependent oxidoreductase [Segniliparus sp.]|uniref:NADP-dependent oxidoreductase n=1 Tax=Segniliparus sp. TaxID=2804064 RepID=UPI003F2D66CB